MHACPSPAHPRPALAARGLTMGLALGLAVLLSACATRPAAPPAPFVPAALTADTRRLAFDDVARQVSRQYVDPQFNGVDWAAVTQRWRERVLGAASDEAFWRELNRMVGELRDAHSRVLSPMELGATREQRGAHGLRLQPHEGRWLLMAVAGNSQAALLGLRPGDEVSAVDGEPIAAWWARQAQEVRGSSTERSQRGLINQALNAGEVGSRRQIDGRHADGRPFSLALQQDALQHPAVRAHRLADGTGYLRFASFAPGLASELHQSLLRLAPSERLVLDLRGNPGGALKLANALLGWFVPPGSAGRIVTRDNQRITVLAGLLDVTPDLDIPAQPQRLGQPLAVLVDEASASGAELMAAVLQQRGRARVFGSTSCGCLLAVRQGQALPGGGRLVISEVDMLIDGQRRVEGVGVVPDQTVWPDPAAERAGLDPVLAAARSWLATQPAGRAMATGDNARP